MSSRPLRVDQFPVNWQPPPGYDSVASSVEGISIWAPKKEAVQAEAPVTYKCPNCGATTKYDIAAGGVACEYCGYQSATKADRVGSQAEVFEFTLDTLKQAEQGWGVERRELHCESCGASITLASDSLTATCPFCASNQVNIRQAPSDVLRPRFLVPFKVQANVLRARSSEWLGKGWFHPDALKHTAGIDRFVGIYLPFWTFSATVQAAWEAEVGYERTETYYDANAKETKTRTVIDWRWEHGTVSINPENLLISGSSHASHVILERLYPYDMNDLVAYLPDFLAGWQASAYDITLPKAWEAGKAVMRDKAKDACYHDISTNHVRNFSMTADLNDETWRYILLPVYLSAYQYEGKVYQVMANGQTGLVAGQKPVAWWKVWLAIAALLTPGGLITLGGLPLLLAGGIGIVAVVIGLILLVPGGIFSVMIYKQAVDSEAI